MTSETLTPDHLREFLAERTDIALAVVEFYRMHEERISVLEPEKRDVFAMILDKGGAKDIALAIRTTRAYVEALATKERLDEYIKNMRGPLETYGFNIDEFMNSAYKKMADYLSRIELAKQNNGEMDGYIQKLDDYIKRVEGLIRFLEVALSYINKFEMGLRSKIEFTEHKMEDGKPETRFSESGPNEYAALFMELEAQKEKFTHLLSGSPAIKFQLEELRAKLIIEEINSSVQWILQGQIHSSLFLHLAKHQVILNGASEAQQEMAQIHQITYNAPSFKKAEMAFFLKDPEGYLTYATNLPKKSHPEVVSGVIQEELNTLREIVSILCNIDASSAMAHHFAAKRLATSIDIKLTAAEKMKIDPSSFRIELNQICEDGMVGKYRISDLIN